MYIDDEICRMSSLDNHQRKKCYNINKRIVVLQVMVQSYILMEG